jgi:integrase
MPLTDVSVRNAKPTEKTHRLFDRGGLYLEVSPSGGKWWRLKYRHLGKEKRLSLGTYPAVSLKEARERRDAARRLLASGDDPSEVRQAEKAERQAATEQSLANVASAWLDHRSTAWAEKTRDMIRGSLERYVFPQLGAKLVDEITPADVRAVVQATEATGAGETAGRIFQRLRAIFRYAVAHELVAQDPTYPLKPAEILKPRKTTHRAALPEREAPAFLRQLDAYDGDPSTKHALSLLILTAVRPGELRGACWSEIDAAGALWRIPADRMKMKTEHTVPLSSQALAVLEQMRPLSGGGALVFPSPYYPGKPLSENTFNSALARLGYKGIATAHGFRTLFSTCANEAGWNRDVIEKQLAHEDRDEVRGAYNRAQYLDERTKLMQWWADRIDAMRKGAEIIPFRAA